MMDKCEAAECYWALLHLVIVMPDVCAALEHDKGDTAGESGKRYEAWCKSFWTTDAMSPQLR